MSRATASLGIRVRGGGATRLGGGGRASLAPALPAASTCTASFASSVILCSCVVSTLARPPNTLTPVAPASFTSMSPNELESAVVLAVGVTISVACSPTEKLMCPVWTRHAAVEDSAVPPMWTTLAGRTRTTFPESNAISAAPEASVCTTSPTLRRSASRACAQVSCATGLRFTGPSSAVSRATSSPSRGVGWWTKKYQ